MESPAGWAGGIGNWVTMWADAREHGRVAEMIEAREKFAALIDEAMKVEDGIWLTEATKSLRSWVTSVRQDANQYWRATRDPSAQKKALGLNVAADELQSIAGLIVKRARALGFEIEPPASPVLVTVPETPQRKRWFRRN